MANETSHAQNLHVQNCWVLGIERMIVDQHGGVDDFFEIRAEWADGTVLVLRRNWFDFTRILKKLRDSFPEEIEPSMESLLLEGLYAIREAEDNEAKLERVEGFLRNVVTMPNKYSQSDAVLSFFEASHLDLMIGNNLDPTQLLLYSPVTISEIRRSNGFCLANTETIISDASSQAESPPLIASTGHEYEKLSDAEEKKEPLKIVCDHKKAQNPKGDISHIMKTEANPIMKPPRQGIAPEVYISKMTYLHMDAHETDILE